MTPRSDIGPFGIVPSWVIEADISDRAVRLYALLASWADRNNDTATALRATLATRLGVSARSVDRATNELIDLGAVVVTPRFRGGERQANEYVVIAANATRVTLGSDTTVATSRQPCRPIQESLDQEPLDHEAPLALDGEQSYDAHHRERVDELGKAAIGKYADAIMAAWYEGLDPPPIQPWAAVRPIVVKALRATWTPAQVLVGLRGTPTPISGGKLDGELRRRRDEAARKRAARKADPTFL